eukprot:316239_1
MLPTWLYTMLSAAVSLSSLYSPPSSTQLLGICAILIQHYKCKDIPSSAWKPSPLDLYYPINTRARIDEALSPPSQARINPFICTHRSSPIIGAEDGVTADWILGIGTKISTQHPIQRMISQNQSTPFMHTIRIAG